MGRPIGSVGVVGAGTMGGGIAQLALEAGHTVRIHDADPAAAERARARIRDGLVRRAVRLDLDADAIDDWVEGRLAGLRQTRELAELAAASDLVIETVREDAATKRSVFVELDRDADADVVLATNTSALSVAMIGAATTHPERVAGLHFFNPAPVMRLVEVVHAPATDPIVTDRLVSLMEGWGRTPIRCLDAPGFIVNRVNRPFTLEPLAALEAGESTIDAIDRAARSAGYPMGPFELMDLIGLDVNLAVTTALYEAAREIGDPLADRFRPSALQGRLVAAGRLGRKSGGGFHPADADPALTDGPSAVAATAVIERTTLAIIDEAYRALEQGLASASDIDLGLRLGAGHPLGPFERVDRLGGPGAVLERLAGLPERGPRFVPADALVAAARGA